MKVRRLIGSAFCCGIGIFGIMGMWSGISGNAPWLFWVALGSLLFSIGAEMVLLMTTRT